MVIKGVKMGSDGIIEEKAFSVKEPVEERDELMSIGTPSD
jgi:hypothetical protein